MAVPTLGIERGNYWSTEAEEDAVFAWLADQPAATVTTLGTTAQGRPIRMVTFGAVHDTPTLLLLGGMHGNEPSGREVLLWYARELGQGVGLEEVTAGRSVAIVPNTNPDGRENNTRENSAGVDPNRDHLLLAEAEGQAMNVAITATDPVMIVDLHEYGGQDGAAVWGQAHGRADTHPLIAQQGDQALAAAMDAAAAAGHVTAPYPISYRLTLNAVAALMHRVCVLIEVTWRNLTRPQRTNLQRPPLAALVEHFTRNAQALEFAHGTSRTHAARRRGPDLLQVWDEQLADGNGHLVNLAGYDLAEPLPQKWVDAHDIHTDGLFVPIGQPARGILPELLDPDVTAPAVPAARRMAPAVPLTIPVAATVQVDGQRRAVTSMVHQTGGVRRTATIARRTETPPAHLTNGLFQDGLTGWHEYGSTTGTYEAVTEHAGRQGALHLHGDGLVRLETPLLLDHDGVRLNVTAQVWVPEAGMRPGQIQIADGHDNSVIATPINPADGQLQAGWNELWATVALSDQGRTSFLLRIAQVAAVQTNPAYWRITETAVI